VFALFAADVEVGDKADGAAADYAAEDALTLQPCDNAGSIAIVAQGEKNDVGLDGR